jgi:hypothetical protein
MTFSLYAATIPSYRQVLGSVAGLLDKAEAFCAEKGVAPETLIHAKLAEDMLPFAYQVKATCEHSLGAIAGIRKGVFSPDVSPPPQTFSALKTKIADTRDAIEAIDAKEVESFIGRDMRFSFRDRHMDFTAEDFLLSFAQPNFYFHASTAYDILRWKGMSIGKRDFIGRLRLKPSA